ncbi:MAG: hypothetical protein IPI49_03820 [Myxococcales bacterium]|nr:hypothetical protein [Myxococcales bacterium]
MTSLPQDLAPAWDDRRLCPDGGCVGVLGLDGRCPLCGRVDATTARPILAAAAASAPSQAGAASSGERDDSSVGGDLASGAEPKASEVAKAAKAAELDDGGDPWQTRQLCDDGSCIGVVVDGRCTTCGKTPS